MNFLWMADITLPVTYRTMHSPSLCILYLICTLISVCIKYVDKNTHIFRVILEVKQCVLKRRRAFVLHLSQLPQSSCLVFNIPYTYACVVASVQLQNYRAGSFLLALQNSPMFFVFSENLNIKEITLKTRQWLQAFCIVLCFKTKPDSHNVTIYLNFQKTLSLISSLIDKAIIQ